MIGKTILFLGLLVASIPLAQASAIQVNGTCEMGSCSNPDVLAFGGTSLKPFDFTYQFSNTDSYELQGFAVAANIASGFRLGIANFVVTYLGNSSGTASSNDVLTADFLQSVTNSSAGDQSVFESIGGFFGEGLGLGTSASTQFLIAGQGMPVLGPFTAPPTGFLHSAYGTLYVPAGTPVLDYRYTLTFGEGSQAGSSLLVYPPSMVPEPSTITLVASGVLGLFSIAKRRMGRV